MSSDRGHMSGALWPRNESSRLSIGGSLPSLKEELAAQIDLVEHRIRELKADLSALRKAHRSLSNRVSDVPTATKKAKSQPAGRWSGGSDAATLRDFVRSTLAREGKPLGRKELFARIEAAGITLDSKVPLKRLSKVMWESEEFTYTPSGYWFAEGFEARFTKES